MGWSEVSHNLCFSEQLRFWSLVTAFKPLCVVSALVCGAPLLYQPPFGGQAAAARSTSTRARSWHCLPIPFPMPMVAVVLSAWHKARVQVQHINNELSCGINLYSEVSAKVCAKAYS